MNHFMEPFVLRKTTVLGPFFCNYSLLFFSVDFRLKCQRNHAIMSGNDIGSVMT